VLRCLAALGQAVRVLASLRARRYLTTRYSETIERSPGSDWPPVGACPSAHNPEPFLIWPRTSQTDSEMVSDAYGCLAPI
jgi:hypothetical protein